MKAKDIFLGSEKKYFKEIMFTLKTGKLKPVFTSAECMTNNEFTCMLDSGAGIPVWCTGADTLYDAFPQASVRCDLKGILSGFGTQFEIADVAYIPKVEICNGEKSIIFNDFYLPIANRVRFGTDLIIPSSMFKNSNIILSQLQSLDNQKKLFIQYQTGYYKAQYTARYLSMESVTNLNKFCKEQKITIDTRIIGGEGEFNRVLTQEEFEQESEFFDDFTEELANSPVSQGESPDSSESSEANPVNALL